MPTEAEFSLKLRKELLKKNPNLTIIKFADQFTAAIPDFMVNTYGVTTFFELKLMTNKKLFEPIQFEMLRKLDRGFYIFWNTKAKLGRVFHVYGYLDQAILGYDVNPELDFDSLVERVLQIAVQTGELNGT